MSAILLAIVLMQRVPVQQTQPVPKPASIHGRVLRSDGHPLAGADVRLTPVGRRARVYSTVTDDAGAYTLEDVAPGSYRLMAGKPGYLTMLAGGHLPDEGADPLTVGEGQIIEHLDVTLPRHSAIAGRVVDENGDPVEGASVHAQRVEFADGRYQFVDAVPPRLTNDQGRFRLYGLEPGRYLVSALVGQVDYPGPGMVNLPGYAPTFYPGTASTGDAQPITVPLSQDVVGLELPLVAVHTARISGIAVLSDGEPVTGGLTLRPSVRGRGAAPAVGAKIDQKTGAFEFPNVAPGEYVVQVSRGGRSSHEEGEFVSRFVRVNGADVTGLVVRSSPGSRVTGRVTLEGGTAGPDEFEIRPLPADFDLAPVNGGAIARADIHPDWTFEMSGLNGPRRIRLARAPDGWALKTVRVNGVDATDSVLAFGTSDDSLGDVEIVLTRQTAEISGTAFVDARRSAVDFTVIAYSADRQEWYPESRFLARAAARNGEFHLRGLPAGDYYVVAVDRVRGDEWQDPAILEALVPDAVRQTLGEGQKIDLQLKLTTIPR